MSLSIFLDRAGPLYFEISVLEAFFTLRLVIPESLRDNIPTFPISFPFLSGRMRVKHMTMCGLLLWYVGFFLFMGIAPYDPESWAFANILPLLFVGVLTITYRQLPFSSVSYLLLAMFLTLHTIGSHYTYAQVPFGLWLEELFELPRNHFDRIVHFCFGLLFAQPLFELFGRVPGIPRWIRAGMVLLALVGLGGLWEILESWVTRLVHPEMGLAYLGAQGDIWDAQKDMAATFYGALIWWGIMIGTWRFTGSRLALERSGESSSCV